MSCGVTFFHICITFAAKHVSNAFWPWTMLNLDIISIHTLALFWPAKNITSSMRKSEAWGAAKYNAYRHKVCEELQNCIEKVTETDFCKINSALSATRARLLVISYKKFIITCFTRNSRRTYINTALIILHNKRERHFLSQKGWNYE